MAAMPSGAAPQVFSYFRQRISPVAAAGIVGNTQQESGNDPNARGGGLIQGQGGRTSRGTLQQQLAGVWGELNGAERGTLQALRAARTPQQAAQIFSQRFERPGVPMLSNRERYAREALASYGGASGAQQGAQGGAAGTPGQISVQTSQSPGGVDPAALSAVLAEVKQLAGPSVVAASAAPAPPAFSAGPTLPEGSRPIAPLRPVSSPQQKIQQLLEGVLGSASPGGPESKLTTAEGYAPAGHPIHANGPLAGLLPKGAMLSLKRIDEGQDGQTNPGGPIIANGQGRVLEVKSDPNGFGPSYPVVVFTSGPLAGKGPIYLGHTLAAKRAGQSFNPGEVISRTGTHGVGNATVPGWFEFGFANTLGQGDKGQGRLIAPLLR